MLMRRPVFLSPTKFASTVPLNISYMGTKRLLAPAVAEVVSSCKSGPLLDVFAGMCSVASSVAQSRNVWCNDAQLFATEVATAFLRSQWELPSSAVVQALVAPLYDRNAAALRTRFGRPLALERKALAKRSVAELSELERKLPNCASSYAFERERRRLTLRKTEPPYRLFALTYPASYFGLEQCVEIDSIRFAIDELRTSTILSGEQHRWLVIALCTAMARVATSTGHFAQPMSVNHATKRRYTAQRRRSVVAEFLAAIPDCRPVGTSGWRRRNRVFQGDANSLLRRLVAERDEPAVVYADPPYTKDQYSRFYHLYETAVLYDYPRSTGNGRYRDGRFVSPFSIASKVRGAIETLAKSCAELGSALVLSYPREGLLRGSALEIPRLLRTWFGHVEVAAAIRHQHSSLGASKGRHAHNVTEIIYLAR